MDIENYDFESKLEQGFKTLFNTAGIDLHIADDVDDDLPDENVRLDLSVGSVISDEHLKDSTIYDNYGGALEIEIQSPRVDDQVAKKIFKPIDISGASAAYSLRKLKDSYNGPVVEVRRSSDDTEADFTAVEVADGALLAWVGTGGTDNGFVTTWYDQSGNTAHATQATTTSQPKVVDAGVLVLSNGNAAIKSTAGNEMTFSMASLSADGQQSVFSVLEDDVTSQDDFTGAFKAISGTLSSSLSRRPNWYKEPTGSLVFSVDATTGYSTTDRDRRLYSHVMNETAGGTSTIYQDGNQVDTRSITLDTNASFSAGAIAEVGTNAVGALYMSELIYYPSDQSANRLRYEYDIANYYGIEIGPPTYQGETLFTSRHTELVATARKAIEEIDAAVLATNWPGALSPTKIKPTGTERDNDAEHRVTKLSYDLQFRIT